MLRVQHEERRGERYCDRSRLRDFYALKRLKQFVELVMKMFDEDVVMKMFDDERLNGLCRGAGRSPDTQMLPCCLRFEEQS